MNPPGDWRIWAEYESASRGRAQLVWSRKRKNAKEMRHRLWNEVLETRGDSANQTDEAVADERTDGDVVLVISRNGWYQKMLKNPEWLPQLLEVVGDDPRAALKLLCDRKVSFTDCLRWSTSPRAA